MAKKNAKEEKLNYGAEIRKLKESGPRRLYLLWGPEDYLREQYLNALKKLCLPEGEDSFSFKRINGPALELNELQQAIDAIPFMTERSFVELRDVDINKLKEPESYAKALADIPDYCTVVFVQNAQYEPDGRLKLIRSIRSTGAELKFTRQTQGMLIDWITRRFAAAGKSIELQAAQRLIFISGDIMSRLIPEIEKVAAYAKGDKVTVEDVEAVANHIPEAVIFDMTEYLAQKKTNSAISVLAELLADKNNDPNGMLIILGNQMRRLYTARLALDKGLGAKYVMDVHDLKLDFIASKLLNAARGFTLPQLIRSVEICAETGFRMRGGNEQETRGLMKEAVLRIAAGETHENG